MDQGQREPKAFLQWKRIMYWLTKSTEVFVIFLFCCMTVLVAAGVAWRYLLGHSIFFASELSRYILVWLVFLGSSLAIRHGAHVGMVFVRERVSPAWRKAMVYLAFSLVGFFLLVVFCVSVVYLLPPLWTQVTAVMGVRLFWIFLCIPIGSFLMFIQTIDFMIRYRS